MNEWHRPGTLPVDRAREVARTCWEALRRVDPEAAELIAQACVAGGELWLAPEIAQYSMDDEVSPVEAAHLVGRSARTVYDWVAKDRERLAIIGLDRLIRVRVGDILEYAATERRAHPPPNESANEP